MEESKKISRTVIRRLPKYYRCLEELTSRRKSRTSSQELGKMTGFTASQIRQDLNNFGGFGQQGYGYNVAVLMRELEKILGLDEVFTAVVVGSGNLGQAIANYKDFEKAGFQIKALFDTNPKMVGKKFRDIPVKKASTLSKFIQEHQIDIAILTVPKEFAQAVADEVVEAGVKSIWNFAPIDIEVPKHVILESVRLNDSLYTLSYYMKNGMP